MTARAYTVVELDDLRRVVSEKWLFGSYNAASSRPGPEFGRVSRSYREEERTKCVEEIVRTHMLAGHTADDLLASEAAER